MAGVGDEHSHRDHISQGATGFLEGLTEPGKYLTDLPVKIAGKRFAGRICRADLPNKKLRSSKYLNNLIEQDHRGVKQRIAVMLVHRFRISASMDHAAVSIL